MNERKARALLYERSGRICEMCGGARAVEAHHRKNRSQGGVWSPENLLHLCSAHHRQCTVNPRLARESGWSVSAYADPATERVWLAGVGWSMLRPDGTVEPAG